ncbi:MAG: ABC transporter ATP-binding protein, partial [Vallitaleaceae bacterium]|nr:ABC transporter ATP-binding protein [Vallitaleaceae bacterium]
YKLIRNMGFYWGISDFLCFTQAMITIIAGIFFVIRGEITMGTYIAFVSYGNMIIWPVRMMGRLLTDFGKARISGGRIQEILSVTQEEKSGGRPEIRGDMALHDIHFSFGETEILKGITMTIKPGQMVGIVGPTGSGKTTLANVLIGMLTPDSGTITLDGMPLNTIDKEHLRKEISLVMQNTFLFAKSLEENIKISSDHLGRVEVERAAKISSIHDSILTFEQGYETVVGEKGVSLSGGQKQRVSIARKIIEDSKIIIFDDSLSAVDTDTEIKIIQSLIELKNTLGMVLISHRITSVMDADVIYVLEDGVITDSGTHAELKEKNDFYRSVCDVQEADYREVQHV